MNYKKFGIVAIIISSVIVVTCFVLCFIKTDAPLTLSKPSTFYIYNHSTTATQVSESENSEKFNSIYSNIIDMTNLNVFIRLAQGGKLDEKPTQDVDCKIGYYSNQLKQENLCLEVVFEDIQRQIIQIDGNTKVLEYYSMLFVVEKSGTHTVAIYLNQNSGNRVYNGLPMLVRANTTNLHNACVK